MIINHKHRGRNVPIAVAISCLALGACGDAAVDSADPDTSGALDGSGTVEPHEAPGTYDFWVAGCYEGPPDHSCDCGVTKAECVAGDGAQFPTWSEECSTSCSSVTYTGQSMRQVLITDLVSFIGGLTEAIDTQVIEPATSDEVIDLMDFYFRFDAESDGETEIDASIFLTKSANPTTALKEVTYSDISTSNLYKKLAGNDAATDYECWALSEMCSETAFAGWGDVASPEELVITWFTMLGDNAVARATGELPTDVHLTAQGHDLGQLIQKFLSVAIAFSQGTDDYLDDDVEGKGLKSSNDLVEGQAYTDLAHAWDEGFGYYGAARDNGSYTDAEVAGRGDEDARQGYYDTDEDGLISLKAEYNFGASQNAAKRDLASSPDAKTDFSAQIFEAFLAGRTLIHHNPGPLSDALMTELMGYRDAIVGSWEKTYAATVVHYINAVIKDMATLGADDYSFADHAKHWSEMKGFALAFQFNPRSPMSDADFFAIHEFIGIAPVLSGDAEVAAYKAALLDARGILQGAYGFAEVNMGDEGGQGGW
jgi:hypothetical protein